MGDWGWRARVRWVVVSPDGQKVLMLGGAALPEVELRGQVWTADAAVTVGALRELVGFEAVVLWCAEEREDTEARVQEATLVAATRGEAALPAGARWVEREELVGVAARSLDELSGRRVFAHRAPWADPGWFDDAGRWVRSSLGALGYAVTGPVEQMRVYELSCILRAPTRRGDVYFKAVPDSPLFVNEGVVTRALAELFPACVPAPLAVEAERRWMMLADFGEEIGFGAPVDVREDVVRTFARLQIEAASLTDRLLMWGCLDRRLSRLAEEAERWLPALGGTGRLPAIDAATWLTADEMVELSAAVPYVTAMCAELATYAVPPSLVHGDMQLSNVARGPQGYLFFDWTDACIAHPFVDLLTMFIDDEEEVHDGLQDRLRDAYLSEWADFEPADRLMRAWQLVEGLGALHHAISYRSFVANVEPPIDSHMARSTAYWLRKVIAALRSAS